MCRILLAAILGSCLLPALAQTAEGPRVFGTTAYPLPDDYRPRILPAPDLAGTWSGSNWGQVELIPGEDETYTGTYSDTYGKDTGRLRVRWSAQTRRFEGTWSEGAYRHGRVSIRVLSGGKAIRGAYTTDLSCEIRPGIPALADLEWKRN